MCAYRVQNFAQLTMLLYYARSSPMKNGKGISDERVHIQSIEWAICIKQQFIKRKTIWQGLSNTAISNAYRASSIIYWLVFFSAPNFYRSGSWLHTHYKPPDYTGVFSSSSWYALLEIMQNNHRHPPHLKLEDSIEGSSFFSHKPEEEKTMCLLSSFKVKDCLPSTHPSLADLKTNLVNKHC